MAVIRSVVKNVDGNIDAKCYVQSFNSSKCYSMWNIVTSCLFAQVLACLVTILFNHVNQFSFTFGFLFFP